MGLGMCHVMPHATCGRVATLSAGDSWERGESLTLPVPKGGGGQCTAMEHGPAQPNTRRHFRHQESPEKQKGSGRGCLVRLDKN